MCSVIGRIIVKAAKILVVFGIVSSYTICPLFREDRQQVRYSRELVSD